MAMCKYCQKVITWMKDGRKNIPVEHDGTLHRCDEMLNARESFRKIEVNTLSTDEIKKYEEAMNAQARKKSVLKKR
jgi:hypothetical protein